MTTRIAVLNIEDSLDESNTIQAELAKFFDDVIFKRVSSSSELLGALSERRWDVVLSDYNLDSITPKKALEIVHFHFKDIPFILVSGPIGEESVAEIMRQGAEDFIIKTRLHRLGPVIKRIRREHETKEKERLAHRLIDEANAAKAQMLAIVSHDIKNPLSAIQLEAQMLMRVTERHGKSTLSEEVKIQAARILKTTERLKLLICDLLDKNKSQDSLTTLNKEQVSLGKLFFDVLDSIRPHVQQKEILIRSSFPPDEDALLVDRNKMFQVISNLLTNAVKFTPVGGKIEVSVEKNEGEVLFSLLDSGPGLPESDLQKVFEKFWTGKVSGCSGTGLGLFICKSIIEAHGGEIWVENVSHWGARFCFRIPISEEKRGTFGSKRAVRWPLQKRIVIIDDDEDLREVISWALNSEGYSVQAYHDPLKALEELKRGPAPHLILADYHMEGMKGGEFLRLKSEILTPDVNSCPVVMISASPKEIEQEIDLKLYKEIIIKPLDLESLIQKVKQYLS
jgi:signal transduction histidine kinase